LYVKVVQILDQQKWPNHLTQQMLIHLTDFVLSLITMRISKKVVPAIKSHLVNSIELEDLQSLSLREASPPESQILLFSKVERHTRPGSNGVSGMTRMEFQ